MGIRFLSPELVSRTRKERHLLKLSEDEFRDQVVRPVLLRQGLKDGRDLCGPEEEGKDALFIETNALGMDDVWVVQTKKGALTMAGSAEKNVIQAIVQLRMALSTRYVFADTKEKKIPQKAILCASGKINGSARKHIADEVSDPRLVFLDADTIIGLVDKHYPELWLGIDADAAPYFRNLRSALEETTESVNVSDMLGADGAGSSAIVDENWVPLHLYRPVTRISRSKGQVERKLEFVEVPVTSVTSLPEKRILIIGDAGSGKSTALRRIAYKLAEKAIAKRQEAIPVILRARDLAASDDDLLGDIVEHTSEIAQSKNPVFGPVDLTSGRLVLLIDALDEIPVDADRERVLRRLEGVHQAYPDTRIIITTREYSFLGETQALAGYTRVRLAEIDLREAKQIVERVARGKKIPVEGRQELLRRLQEVHGFQLNPLLVTVFVATSDYARRDIPANITELFKKFTELMLGRWDASKGFAKQYQAPLKDFLLQRVAYKMHERRATSIASGEFRSLIADELSCRGLRADAAQIVDEIVNRSGLLRSVGANLEFRHHLVQEFFAGRALQPETVAALASDEWWQRPLVFFFGDNAEKYSVLAGVCAAIPKGDEASHFTAAVTVGLALQACYLVPVPQKIEILKWVIDRLAHCGVEDPKEPSRLMDVLTYYLMGRDAVSCAVLGEESARDLALNLPAGEGSPEEAELRLYWYIVGLIESGNLDQADERIRAFRPADKRLLLTLHLGCYLLTEHRVGTPDEKRKAKEISEYLEPVIGAMRSQLLKQLDSELLEIHEGKLKALPEKKENGPVTQSASEPGLNRESR